MDIRSILGANLRSAQDDLGLTNRELADAVGIHDRLFMKHRAGSVMPGPDTLVRYADVIGRPVSWLFEDHSQGRRAA